MSKIFFLNFLFFSNFFLIIFPFTEYFSDFSLIFNDFFSIYRYFIAIKINHFEFLEKTRRIPDILNFWRRVFSA